MSKNLHSIEDEQREGLLKDNLTEADIGQSQLSPTIREVLLVEDEAPRVSVGSWYLFLLTCCLGGLQAIWTVILANGSPFLVSLGLSKSLTALVWVAAPLCGTVVQPLIGSLGDRSQNRFGRRRPFILGGSVGIAISVLFLAWTPELVHASIVGAEGEADKDGSRAASIYIAIFWIYVLNISIQCVQSGSRALIIEACPAHQQEQGSAWASITIGGWNIFGYLCGFTALPEVFSTHLTQFQCLSLIASISMMSTALVTCYSIHEPSAAQQANPIKRTSSGMMAIIDDLSYTYRHMPSKIRRICLIQFWAWMGRFPFLFYSTTYVAEFYRDHTTLTDLSASIDQKPLTQDAIRHGTFANFLFAIIAFVTSISIPFLLKLSQNPSDAYKKAPSAKSRYHIAQAWSISHFLWAVIMFSTFFIDNPTSATILVSSLGLLWAVTLWAPFAIIGKELTASEALREQMDREGEDEDEHRDATGGNKEEVQAAAVMGIHNAACSAPQVVAALICSAVFSVVKAMGWGNGTAWVMRVGGVAALGAGCLNWGSDI